MRPQWLSWLGAAGWLLVASGPAQAQEGDTEAFTQALEQCQSAQSAAQCKAALPACEQAQRILAARSASVESDQQKDRLLSHSARCEYVVGQYAQAAAHYRSLLSVREHRYGP